MTATQSPVDVARVYVIADLYTALLQTIPAILRTLTIIETYGLSTEASRHELQAIEYQLLTFGPYAIRYNDALAVWRVRIALMRLSRNMGYFSPKQLAEMSQRVGYQQSVHAQLARDILHAYGLAGHQG